MVSGGEGTTCNIWHQPFCFEVASLHCPVHLMETFTPLQFFILKMSNTQTS